MKAFSGSPSQSLHVLNFSTIHASRPAGESFSFFSVTAAPPEISPDGQKVVFGAEVSGKVMLFVKSLADATPRRLAGTESARFPFWSPDNRWIGFFADNKLMKIGWEGGSPEILADAPDARGQVTPSLDDDVPRT